MRNAILAAFVVFVAAVLVTGAQGYPTPQCTCPDGYVAQCVAMTATNVPPTATPETGGGEMASEGPNSPNTVANVSTGWYAWQNPGNAASSNNNYASTAIYGPGYTDRLTATDFDFAIPDGATIDGIKVEIECHADYDSDDYVDTLELYTINGDGISVSNLGDFGTKWPTSDAIKTYGGESELWGESWSPADINATSFGAALSIASHMYDYGSEAYVDHIRITVYYTEGGATRSQYRAMLGAGW